MQTYIHTYTHTSQFSGSVQCYVCRPINTPVRSSSQHHLWRVLAVECVALLLRSGRSLFQISDQSSSDLSDASVLFLSAVLYLKVDEDGVLHKFIRLTFNFRNYITGTIDSLSE